MNSPGFGVALVKPASTEVALGGWPERPDPPPQPDSLGPPWEAGGFRESPVAWAEFEGLYSNGLVDFVNPNGWGYVRSRHKVAGFLPHAFSRVPEVREWKVQRVELVELLKHPEPVVYQTDRLPAMANVATAPTRPLDGFETAGLAAIRRGEDGYAATRESEVRFIGAVRSAAACVECHGGERGDLLGVFSYRLWSAER